MNTKVFDRINYGLFLISAAADRKRSGCVVNSLHQVTAIKPFRFSLTLNKSNETFKCVEAAGSFAATVLKKDCPKDLVNQFGYKSSRVIDKFEGLQLAEDEAGNPYVKDYALARISFKIVDKLDLGGYMLYICEATETESLSDGQALTLDDFKNSGAVTPPTATVYRTLEGNEGWQCTVCGYIALKDELPDDFQCPLCRANRDKFVKL